MLIFIWVFSCISFCLLHYAFSFLKGISQMREGHRKTPHSHPLWNSSLDQILQRLYNFHFLIVEVLLIGNEFHYRLRKKYLRILPQEFLMTSFLLIDISIRLLSSFSSCYLHTAGDCNMYKTAFWLGFIIVFTPLFFPKFLLILANIWGL